MPAALAAITVLRPGIDGRERDFELRIVSTGEATPDTAAYIAVDAVSEVADIVLALADIANAPRVA